MHGIMNSMSVTPLLPLRHLRAFAAVARAGSVRGASDVLLRAASAVSRSVTLLEAALGTQLFERRGQGMLNTRAADLVLGRLEGIERELDAVLSESMPTRACTRAASVREVLFDERRLLAASALGEIQHMPTVARQLGVTQPAVSAALARLEEVLGHKLFLRSARGLLPTDVGARCLVRFGRVLAELRHIEDDVNAAQGRLEGLVTVGTLPLARTRLLPMAIDALMAQHPLLRVHSLESPYEQLCAGLLGGKVDFILGALRPIADRELVSEVLFTEQLHVIASTSHPLANRRNLSLADLRPYPWILSRPGTPLRESLAQFFVSHAEPAPRATVETGDQALVRGMLLRGKMLTVLSTHQLHYEIEAGHLRALDLPMTGLERHIGVTLRSGARLSASSTALMAHIRSAVKDGRFGSVDPPG